LNEASGLGPITMDVVFGAGADVGGGQFRAGNLHLFTVSEGGMLMTMILGTLYIASEFRTAQKGYPENRHLILIFGHS
jgi:hypothetical protein